jgi:hypothetical protein
MDESKEPVCSRCGEAFVAGEIIVLPNARDAYHARCAPGTETIAFDNRREGDPDLGELDMPNGKPS